MMPSLLINFAVGAAVSCVATLPLGVLNLTIMRVTVREGIRAAIYFALACALIELFYSYASVQITHGIGMFPALAVATQVVSVLMLIGIGVHYILKNGTPTATIRPITNPFWLGVSLSVFNFVAIPFWVAYTNLLEMSGYVGTQGTIPSLLYIVGISVGTILGLLIFVAASRQLGTYLIRHQHKIDRWMGILFIGLSIFKGAELAF